MEFYYENHIGQRINFYDSPYILPEHAFADWTMSYQTINKRSTGFTFEPTTHSFKVRIMPRETEADGREAAFKQYYNQFVNVIAQDTDEPGKLWTTGGEYLECRIITANKDYWTKYRDVSISCVLFADNPVWIREKKYSKGASGIIGGDFLDYPYDFVYDFTPVDASLLTINNKGYGAANYRLIMYGAAVNPSIVLDDRQIGVNTILSESDYLVVDSKTHEVYTVNRYGTRINQYNNRTKTDDIFAQVSPGQHNLYHSGLFGYDFYLYEERREPEWI